MPLWLQTALEIGGIVWIVATLAGMALVSGGTQLAEDCENEQGEWIGFLRFDMGEDEGEQPW